MKKIAVLAYCLALSACANTNMGEVSFRRASPPPALDEAERNFRLQCRGTWNRRPEDLQNDEAFRTAQITGARETLEARQQALAAARDAVADGAAPTNAQALAIESAEAQVEAATADLNSAEASTVCPVMLEARLDMQNYGFGEPILADEFYSIRLEHAVLAELSEINFSGRRFLQGIDTDRQIGEIAILANVFEFGGSNPRFLDAASVTSATVVYYSNDVEQHQDLNFHNIPIQAPVQYSGNPVGIQLFVIELDRVSEPAQALIQELAALGSSVGLIPGGQAAETLKTLGSALLNGNSDDLVFEYRMVLDPVGSGGENYNASATFEAGRYVLMRNEYRDQDIEWENYRIDHNTGRVYEFGSSGAELVTDRSYMTVNVIRHPAGVGASTFDMITFDTLNDRLRTFENARDNWMTVATAEIQRELGEARAQELSSRLANRWSALTTHAISYGARNLANNAECRLNAQGARERDRHYTLALQEAAAFIADYHSAVGEQVGEDGSEPVLDENANRAILANLVGFFVPFGGTSEDVIRESLLSPGNFGTAYPQDSTTFVETVAGELERNYERGICTQLIELNLAEALPAEE